VQFEIGPEESRSQLGNELFAPVTFAGTTGGGASLQGIARERAPLLKIHCNPDRSPETFYPAEDYNSNIWRSEAWRAATSRRKGRMKFHRVRSETVRVGGLDPFDRWLTMGAADGFPGPRILLSRASSPPNCWVLSASRTPS
jgi:hypothetical protein